MGHTHLTIHAPLWGNFSFIGYSTMNYTYILTRTIYWRGAGGFFGQIKLFCCSTIQWSGPDFLIRITLSSTLPCWGPESSWHTSQAVFFGLSPSKYQVFRPISIRPNLTQQDQLRRGGCVPMTSLFNSWNWTVRNFPWVSQTNTTCPTGLITPPP